jgi:hypothetical protein
MDSYQSAIDGSEYAAAVSAVCMELDAATAAATAAAAQHCIARTFCSSAEQ